MRGRVTPIDLSFFRSETSQRLREEGRTEGLIEGEAKGEAKTTARNILRVLERRGVTVGDDARDRITSCTDRHMLESWLDRAVTVTAATELFESE